MHAAAAGPGGQSEQCVFGSGRRLGHCASAAARRVASSVLRICGQPPHGLQVPVALETTQSASSSQAWAVEPRAAGGGSVGGFAGASGVDGTEGSRGGGVVGPGAPGGGGEVDEQARTPNASSSGRTR